MGELLHLVGGAPVVVGLVVRVGAHHQLAVVAVVVSQDAGVPLRVGAPEPEFAALDDVVVARQHRAGLAPVVVSGDEVLLEVVDEHRVGHEMVLPPRGVDAVGVAVAGASVGAGAALLFLILAFAGVAVCLLFRRDRHIRALER